MSAVKYSPLSQPSTESTPPRCRVVLLVVSGSVVAALLLGLVLWSAHVKEELQNYSATGQAFLDTAFQVAHNPHFHYWSIDKQENDDVGCRVQFVFAGSKYDYNQFPTMQSWIRYADPKCPIEIIRPNHAVFNQLTPIEKPVFYDSAYLPILQADFMKLLVMYYLGGLVTDLDVEALKPFPTAWTGPGTALATCDVVLGIEVNCFDDECAKTMARKGQIQNWSMWSRRRHSPFLGQLIEYVVAKYKTFPSHDKHVAVQEVFGSGSITDFVRLYGNFVNTTHYETATNDAGETLQGVLGSVLRVHKQGEEVCIVGSYWTGGGCSVASECLISHHYEGSWKKNWWSWDP
ncbi:Aste57867_12681 [Aphanomyces stellatus]|uniref:Aste57867_12681 protein n=1 Tax=Aphanomyces stellatus TaxID=120398 RepID=A0A485KX07_9STRA|nr:hypothetical protein As57867_012634 [Aphanomyces stellatus]VFT89531.1 Aste57867_12681 [Aphanomyces stellatus]